MSAPAAPPIRLDAIGQIAIRARDVARAEAFYRDVLGMEHLFSAPPGLAFFRCGGVRLMLSAPEGVEFDHPASILYYRVDDVPAAHEALTARGVHFEDEPHVVHRTDTYELWMASFRDSEDNVLALMAEVPAS